MSTKTVDPRELEKFSKDSDLWWDETGPFAPLHRLNPARLAYVRAQILSHLKIQESHKNPLKNIKILDAGCGGGLVCEPLARLGADVHGADADSRAIETAKAHAEESGPKITYHNKESTDLIDKYRNYFDIILALEILEHVADPALFVQSCFDLLRPGGLIVFSTLNRTPQSFVQGIVAAEYLLRWVPRGTHNWKKFMKPSELSACVRQSGGQVRDVTGITYHPFSGSFRISPYRSDVNYFLCATKS